LIFGTIREAELDQHVIDLCRLGFLEVVQCLPERTTMTMKKIANLAAFLVHIPKFDGHCSVDAERRPFVSSAGLSRFVKCVLIELVLRALELLQIKQEQHNVLFGLSAKIVHVIELSIVIPFA
jgi:hypothetical protein